MPPRMQKGNRVWAFPGYSVGRPLLCYLWAIACLVPGPWVMKGHESVWLCFPHNPGYQARGGRRLCVFANRWPVRPSSSGCRDVAQQAENFGWLRRTAAKDVGGALIPGAAGSPPSDWQPQRFLILAKDEQPGNGILPAQSTPVSQCLTEALISGRACLSGEVSETGHDGSRAAQVFRADGSTLDWHRLLVNHFSLHHFLGSFPWVFFFPLS